MREARKIRIYTVWLYLYEIQEQAKIIHVDRSQNGGSLWETDAEWGIVWGKLLGAWGILYLQLGVGHENMPTCKILLSWILKIRYFTIFMSCLNKKNVTHFGYCIRLSLSLLGSPLLSQFWHRAGLFPGHQNRGHYSIWGENLNVGPAIKDVHPVCWFVRQWQPPHSEIVGKLEFVFATQIWEFFVKLVSGSSDSGCLCTCVLLCVHTDAQTDPLLFYGGSFSSLYMSSAFIN